VSKVGAPLDKKGLLGSDFLGSGTLGGMNSLPWKDARIGWFYESGTSCLINETVG
jgi:hypothetical protein